MVLLERDRACCFTGHRILPQESVRPLRHLLRIEVLRLWRQGVDLFLTGGALGFDTLAAQELLLLREDFTPDIRLVLVLPCLGQELKWPRRDQEVYRRIIRQADDVIYTGDQYKPGCMRVRNHYLVNYSAHCITYLRENNPRSGTAQTVRYAQSQGLDIIDLYAQLAAQGPDAAVR